MIRSVVIAIIVAVASAAVTEPTAYRGATISWNRPDPNTRAVAFVVKAFFQANYFSPSVVGSAITLDSTRTWTFNFGDSGTRLLDNSVCKLLSNGDVAEAVCQFSYTYTSAGPFTAYFQSTNRDSTLQNNANQAFRITTVVTLATPNSSPVASAFPITRVAVPTGTLMASAALLAIDPDADVLSYRLTTDITGSGTGAQPSGLSINSSTAQIAWAVGGLSAGNYSASIQVLDTAGALITVDWTLELSFYTPPRNFPTTVVPTMPQVIFLNQGQSQLQFSVTSQSGAVPTILYTGLPATASVSTTSSGTTANSTFTWSPTGPSANVMCFVGVNSGVYSAPLCVAVAAFRRCPSDCWGNGACRSMYGTCQCLPSACLSDCRAVWQDPNYSTGCQVATAAVSFQQNVRGTVTSATIEARLPVNQALGTEIWITLPVGMTTSHSPNVMISISDVQLYDNITGVTPAVQPSVIVMDNTVQLRFGQAFQATDAVRFTLTNLQLPNNCDPMKWTISPMQCDQVDLFGAGAVWKRVCQPVQGVAPISVVYDHKLHCDLCNACRQWQACPDNSMGFTCEHNGVSFTRCGLSTASPCSTLGV